MYERWALIPFYRWGSWGKKQVRNLPEVTQPESEGAGVWTLSVISPQRLSSPANFITAQKNIYLINWVEFVVVQSLSCVRLFATPWTAARQAPLSITIPWSLLRFMFTESMLPPNHLILCHPFLLPPSIFPSIRVLSNESALRIRGPKYWSFSFSISPSNEYSALIFFRIDWFDLLAVQGTLKSLLQHHDSKASILWHSAFFMIQLSHLYTIIGKTIALTIWTFVGKVISLLF